MIEWVSFESKAIAGFPMRDKTVRQFPVYLPPEFSRKPAKPYPVFFMLAGFSGKGATYITDDSCFGVALPDRLDDAIQTKRLPPCLVVFPDCTSRFGCSQYVNSPAFGNYNDYLCDELVTFIDEKYPTHRSADFRGVAGHSSGGFGALITGMFRPDVFRYVCSSAGDTFYEVSLLKNINGVIIELEKAGGLEAFLQKFGEYPTARSIPGGAFECMLTLQMASCYAPNVNKPPLFGDLFFDLHTGEVIPEIWEKYLAWDPVRMVNKYEKNLRQLKYILLEAGSQDEHALHLGHRQFAKQLEQHSIRFELNEYPGTHSGHHWRFEERLIKMARKMAE